MGHVNKMQCPECGAIMNHHADKLMYESAAEPDGASSSGVIAEFYRCPACGAGASRLEGSLTTEV